MMQALQTSTKDNATVLVTTTTSTAAGATAAAAAAAEKSTAIESTAVAARGRQPVTHTLFRPINFDDASPPEAMDSSGCSSLADDSAYSIDQAAQKVYENGTSRKVTAAVQNRSLWKTFTKIGNEMIVTKPGRRLFPALLVSLHGLDPNADYSVSLRVVPSDNQRYRYINLKWCTTGESEVIQNEERQIFHHPSSPNSGQFWMKRPVSFKTIKITHYPKSKQGNILLHTMHKYMMEIIINNGINNIIVPLQDTTFIAVSAYQNMELTQLKIDNNPFAKGFRYKTRSPTMRTTSSAISPHMLSSVFPPNRTMLAYWQHVHHLQGMATSPSYLSPVATKPNISSENSLTGDVSPSSLKKTVSPSALGTTGGMMTPHYPIFYPSPFMSPYHLPATTIATNAATANGIDKK